jgi:vancomycin resistance protein YoaR
MFAVGLAFAIAGAALYELNYRGRIYPGVHAWGVDLSGMTPEEAALSLSSAFTYPQTPGFILWDGIEQRTLAPADLGVQFDMAGTVTAAYSVGRSGNVMTDWLAQYQAWHSGRQIALVMIHDEGRMLAYLNALAQEKFVPVAEASLSAEGTQVIAAPGRIGRQLDVPKLAETLRGHLRALDRAIVVALPFVETAPLVLDASAQAAAAQNILNQPLTLMIATPGEGDPGAWTIEPSALAAMLRIQRVQEGNGARFDVALDANALRGYLEPLAPDLKREPRNARFIFNDETKQLDLLQPSLDARELDVDATIAAINASLLNGEHTVPLVFKTTPPQVTSETTAGQLGITQLVVAVSTSFAGSSAERVKNINIASARFHGLLIAPNETFSFVEHLGDVSLDAGYAEALIIYGGRTIRGVGGGVCQVSSTVFRAAYFGGYPIVERNSHAYRVGYYERNGTWESADGASGRWNDPGLDATVFAPLVDFKFQNDTPYWLLMEVYVSEATGRLTWKFYSTSDGRQVAVSAAKIENVVPHPEPLYEEDPELPPGLENMKQVDYAVDGMDVTVYRTITRDGAQINLGERPLHTKYQPWRAVYHYGPGTEGIPTPTPEATPTPTP